MLIFLQAVYPSTVNLIRLQQFAYLSKSKIQKARWECAELPEPNCATGQSVEKIKQGKFTILLSPLSNGEYEIQVYRMLGYGQRRVTVHLRHSTNQALNTLTHTTRNPVKSAIPLYMSAEFADLLGQSSDYAILNQFEWQENFPSTTAQCPFSPPKNTAGIYTASCFPHRDAALSFATKFITYTNRNRM